MECTLAALIACFSWSGLFVDAGLSYQDIGIPRQEIVTREFNEGGVTTTIISTETLNDAMNPYGWIALGYQVDFAAFRWTLDARHAVSSLQTGDDRGINSINLGVRWYPFRP